MAKGENIFKRKDGRWEGRYIKGYEPSGKIRYGFCYGKTYKDVKDKVMKCKVILENGEEIPTAGSREHFAYSCVEWMRKTDAKRKKSTSVKYAAILEKHILPRLGDYCPQGFTTELIDAFRDELLAKGLAPKTVKDVLVLLRTIYEYTAKHSPGIFPKVEFTYPRVPLQEMRVLSREEQRRFTAYLLEDTDTCRFGILLALFTGMRIGEVCALRWENISLDERTIRITSTIQRLKDTEGTGEKKTKLVTDSPKSEKSRRIIPLTEQAAELCKRMQPEKEAGYVLTGTEQPMEPRKLQYWLKKFTDECGLEGVHFHTLRHTFATRCVEVGFDLKSLSEILGHTNTSLTLNRYVHSSLELKRENMNKLSGLGL